MAMYRELFFNNIEGSLSGNFPVLRKILTDLQWFAFAQDFSAKHPCRSPYFSQIPEEFLDYLQNERDSSEDFPFMLELAHYEWVEMALFIAKEEGRLPIGRSQVISTSRSIALSPLASPLAYQYPVQKIAPAFLPWKRLNDRHFSLFTATGRMMLILLKLRQSPTDYWK